LTYPTALVIPQATVLTDLNPTNWNIFVDQLNALSADMVDARGDGQAFPGTDHIASQSTDLDDAIQAIRHMVAQISGETNWYDAPAGTLKAHTHAVGQGGLIPYSSLGSNNSRSKVFHPAYENVVQTYSLRGAAASGSNTITVSNGIDVVSDADLHYYEGSSAEGTLQDVYIVIAFCIPLNFTSWDTNAIVISFISESDDSANCHVDASVYKSGTSGVIATSSNNVSLTWADITIADSDLGSWVTGNVMELYLKLESKDNNFARIGKVTLNYLS
jgi:hypothetical protein